MGCEKLKYHLYLEDSKPKTLFFEKGGLEKSVPRSENRLSSYRYGFNGMEKDEEIAGDGNNYTTSFRQVDVRIGRWWSLDPLLKRFPWQSPYISMDNNPTNLIDPFGTNAIRGDSEIAEEELEQSSDSDGGDIKNVTEEHKRITQLTSKWTHGESPVEWTNGDIVKWKIKGYDYLHKRKLEYINYYSNVIEDAAKQYDIPVDLLAGVAYNEFGGDPMWIDGSAYSVRLGLEMNNQFVRDGGGGVVVNPDKPSNQTSFGNISTQLRRGLTELGYQNNNCFSPSELKKRNEIIGMLENPISNIYIAAKHLQTLKNIDFPDVSAANMTREQIIITGTRFNRGPDLPINKIKQNTTYGDDFMKVMNDIRQQF